MAQFQYQGASLYYEKHENHSSSASPLVFIHGLTCTHDDWAAQVEYFAPTRNVVTLDLRGHGQSAGYGSGFDPLTMSDDVSALIGSLNLPAAILVGHSMGCRIVLQTARIAPERVAGAVLVDGSRFAEGDPQAARRRVTEQIDAAGYAPLLDRLFEQMFTPDSDAATAQHIIDRARSMPETTGRALLANMSAWDAEHLEAALDSIRVPLLAIQSTHVNEERMRVPLKAGDSTPYLDSITERVQGARAEIVPGAGHFTMIDAAQITNRLIESLTQ